MDILNKDREQAESIRTSTVFEEIRSYLEDFDESTLADQIELTEIAAPPFTEEARAGRMAELLQEAGATDVAMDTEGNVVGWYRGEGHGSRPPGQTPDQTPGQDAPLVVAAHLDTVFPAGTDVTVTRSGDHLRAPGISDDGRGLTALLALCRAFVHCGVVFSRPLMLVATVGEEGLGNLRGVRHLFSPEGAGHGAAAFISLDGAGSRGIVHRGLGSRRFRVEIDGPGGHSWTDWGRVNPIHALASGLASLQEIRLPDATTLSVGRVAGGKSINAVPQTAWAELEIRSEREANLAELEPEVLARLRAAIQEANQRRVRDSDPLTFETIPLGARPAGETAASATLVRAACAATDALGREPVSVLSSTDANVPMSLGIPAITVGAGGEAGGAHTTEEWYKNTNGPDGIVRAALMLMLLEALEA